MMNRKMFVLIMRALLILLITQVGMENSYVPALMSDYAEFLDKEEV